MIRGVRDEQLNGNLSDIKKKQRERKFNEMLKEFQSKDEEEMLYSFKHMSSYEFGRILDETDISHFQSKTEFPVFIGHMLEILASKKYEYDNAQDHLVGYMLSQSKIGEYELVETRLTGTYYCGYLQVKIFDNGEKQIGIKEEYIYNTDNESELFEAEFFNLIKTGEVTIPLYAREIKDGE